VKYNPGDLVKIGLCMDGTPRSNTWSWKDQVGIIVQKLDAQAIVVADAGSGAYDYQLLLNGELLYFREEELEKLS
jgi:hypothetical protein